MHKIQYSVTFTITGSPELYHAVRAGFVNQGTSLNRWCIANGINRQTAEKALRGERRGGASFQLLNQLLAAAGIQTVADTRTQ